MPQRWALVEAPKNTPLPERSCDANEGPAAIREHPIWWRRRPLALRSRAQRRNTAAIGRFRWASSLSPLA